MLRLGFLTSHGGSNMQAIVVACEQGRLAAEPAVVISNNSGSAALTRARAHNIPAFHLSSVTHPDEAELDAAICSTLVEHQVDIVCLAGYMKKVGPITLSAFRSRILNIHPALLPKYGGQGMYGLRVHEAVLAAGESETGATVHVADDAYDRGRILARKSVPVLAGDTAQTLAARVLEAEHELYVETLAGIVDGRIHIEGLRELS